MIGLDERRRFFAEELEAVVKLRSAALVDAFAAVPREQFLRPGPWTVLSDSPDSFMMGASAGIRTRSTPDANPARVYHNIAVAIDPDRQLFNGQPGTLGVWIDMLDLANGARVLHIGAGLGYYTAVIAECVGPGGRVVAYEVDETLAADAHRNLASRPWVDLRQGDGSAGIGGPFDAILVNAGVTHPLDTWLDALAPGGRMMLPLTATLPAMGSTLGKGLVVLVTKEKVRLKPDTTAEATGEAIAEATAEATAEAIAEATAEATAEAIAEATAEPSHEATDDAAYAARVVTVVAVYSAVGVRDPAMNDCVGKALMAGPPKWQAVKRLRRDAHEPAADCWLHGRTCCFSA
jgi:protein-L-isoaspartate(D-aspartate) O-methyltransferase